MWYLELQSLCEILRGHYTTARQYLGSLGRYQKNHFGFFYQSSLMSFLLTCERRFISAEDSVRYDNMEKVIFSGRKLLERVQTCPIGMVSLFLISYSALAILISSKEEEDEGEGGGRRETSDHPSHTPSGSTQVPIAQVPIVTLASSQSFSPSGGVRGMTRGATGKGIFRRGGGTQSRLESIALSCLEALTSLSSRIKCLGILCVTLRLKFACYSGKREARFTLEFFDDLVYTIEYQQFAFALLFWHLEKRAYCTEFGLSSSGEISTQRRGGGGQGAGGGPGSECLVDDGLEVLLRRYHVPEHHFLVNQERDPPHHHRGLELRCSQDSRGGTVIETKSGLEATNVTPFSSY
jgi:hypothetical protein